MEKPSLSDQHWRLSLRDMTSDDLMDELKAAIRDGNAWRFNILMQYPPDVAEQESLLAEALRRDRFDMFLRIAQWGDGWKDSIDDYDFMPQALELGRIAFVRHFIESCGAEINDPSGSVLCRACANGHETMVAYLLSRGADVHAADDIALRTACEGGFYAIARLLVEAGADVHAKEEEPFLEACASGNADLVRYLLAQGADLAVCGGVGMLKATIHGRIDVVRILFAAGVAADSDDGVAQASLAAALEEGYFDLAALLVAHGASVDVDNGAFLRKAAKDGELEKVAFLLSCGANVNLHETAETALILAAEYGRADVVSCLLAAGADHRAFGFLAAHAAHVYGYGDIVAMLEQREKETLAAMEIEKQNEFAHAFSTGYTVGDLRARTGLSGETGLVIAAQTGRFAQVLSAATGADGLCADDLFHPDDSADFLLAALIRHEGVAAFFTPDLWVGRGGQMLAAWHMVPEENRQGVDIEACAAEVDRLTLRHNKPSKPGIKPPRL